MACVKRIEFLSKRGVAKLYSVRGMLASPDHIETLCITTVSSVYIEISLKFILNVSQRVSSLTYVISKAIRGKNKAHGSNDYKQWQSNGECHLNFCFAYSSFLIAMSERRFLKLGEKKLRIH